jgi:hypothetical protein
MASNPSAVGKGIGPVIRPESFTSHLDLAHAVCEVSSYIADCGPCATEEVSGRTAHPERTIRALASQTWSA